MLKGKLCPDYVIAVKPRRIFRDTMYTHSSFFPPLRLYISMKGSARSRGHLFSLRETLEFLGEIPGICIVYRRWDLGTALVHVRLVSFAPLAPAQKVGAQEGHRKVYFQRSFKKLSQLWNEGRFFLLNFESWSIVLIFLPQKLEMTYQDFFGVWSDQEYRIAIFFLNLQLRHNHNQTGSRRTREERSTPVTVA